MPVPKTVFDQPLALLPDPFGRRPYANIDNRIEVSRGAAVHHVAVAVPTELFTFMKEVARISHAEDVTLAIDAIEDGYVFSMLAGDKLFDLWYYSQKSLPEWILSPAHRLYVA